MQKEKYNKYTGFPYRHLGNDKEKGIDCFNLIRYIYKIERGIEIPYLSSDFCNIIDEDWYNKSTVDLFKKGSTQGWDRVSDLEEYDLIMMSIGSTNTTNHCAMYIGGSRIIHTMMGRESFISPYGRYYEQYTVGVLRWKGL